MPSRATIERLINQSGTLLPIGTSAKDLADHVISDLEAAESDQRAACKKLSKLAGALTKIPKGKGAATQYQMAMLDIFRLLFEDRLGAMKPEETIFSGIKRVDINAENDQENGFFIDLQRRHGLHCPRIFFECKNYTEDPDNPAFDQLLARLNPTSTQIGYVVCRQIKNPTKAQQRCKEAFLREGRQKLMLWITDADVVEMAAAFAKGGSTAVDSLLKTRFEAVTLK